MDNNSTELMTSRQNLVKVLLLVQKKVKYTIDMSSDKKYIGASIGGIVYGNVSNASSIYSTDKFYTPRGHGFAAENANHLYDKIANIDFGGQGKVQLVGEDIDPETGRIVKNGADRIVNGVNIQTKYCASGAKCISECFDEGKFRYINSDGSPMQMRWLE